MAGYPSGRGPLFWQLFLRFSAQDVLAIRTA
jgi:hypothetical protein